MSYDKHVNKQSFDYFYRILVMYLKLYEKLNVKDVKLLRIIIIFTIEKSGYWDLDYQQRATNKYSDMSFPKIFYSKICKTTFSIHSRMWNQECFCVGVCSQKILTHCVLSYNIILQWIRTWSYYWWRYIICT